MGALEWWLQFGPDLKFYEEIQESGGKTPLDDVPITSLTTEWYLTTFSRLSSARTGGFGPNPLQISEIDKFFEWFPMPFEMSFVIDIIQQMDQKYITHSAEVTERKNARSRH